MRAKGRCQRRVFDRRLVFQTVARGRRRRAGRKKSRGRLTPYGRTVGSGVIVCVRFWEAARQLTRRGRARAHHRIRGLTPRRGRGGDTVCPRRASIYATKTPGCVLPRHGLFLLKLRKPPFTSGLTALAQAMNKKPYFGDSPGRTSSVNSADSGPVLIRKDGGKWLLLTRVF